VETPDQIGPAIRAALETTKSNMPAVIEMITKEEETVASFW